VDRDGDLDLFMIIAGEPSLPPGAQEVTLFGFLYDGTSFGGADTVYVLP